MEKKNKKIKKGMPKYKWWIVGIICVFIIAYIVIYLCFKGNGFLSAGIDLEKRDWLSFLGAYLTFAGTVLVSLIAIMQSRYYAENEKEKNLIARKKSIQPIFSIDIVEINKQISGTAEVFNPYDNATYPKHKNVTIAIENVGEHPIRNVIIFDTYMFQLLKSNDRKIFQIAYSDSPDITKWKKHLIELLESEYERNKNGIPQWFNINYDDIDGNEMFQIFELKEFEGKDYYSLEGIHEV